MANGYGGYGETSWWKGGEYDASFDWLKGFNGANGYGASNRDLNAGRSSAFYDRLTGGGSMDPASWYNASRQTGSQAQGMLDALMNASKASGTDIQKNWLSVLPGMQDYAAGVADKAYSMQGVDANALAQQMSRQATRGMENRLSGMGALGSANGAALGALNEAAQSPLLQTLSALAQGRAQAYQGALNPLANAAYGRELGRTGEYAQALNGAQGLMGQYGQMGQGLAGLLGDQSQQYLMAPDIRQRTGMGEQLLNAGASGLMNGLGAGLTGGLGSGLSAFLGSGAQSFMDMFKQKPMTGYDFTKAYYQ